MLSLQANQNFEQIPMRGSQLKSLKKPSKMFKNISRNNISPPVLNIETELQPRVIGKNISMPVITPRKIRNSYDRFKLLQSKPEDFSPKNESLLGSMRNSIGTMSPKYKVGSMILDMPESRQTRRSPFINGKSDILEVSSCNPTSTINDDIILKN